MYVCPSPTHHVLFQIIKINEMFLSPVQNILQVNEEEQNGLMLCWAQVLNQIGDKFISEFHV
jgi:hypothetical protein